MASVQKFQYDLIEGLFPGGSSVALACSHRMDLLRNSQTSMPRFSEPAVLTPPAGVLLFDHDSYTASVLLANLRARGFEQIQHVRDALGLSVALQASPPDVLIFNHHPERPDDLSICCTTRLMAPGAAVVVLVAPGPALKQVRAWGKQTRSIDSILEKPLSDELFSTTLEDLLASRFVARELQNRANRLSKLVPVDALPAAESGVDTGASFFEAAVLFTDIRGSSQLIRKLPPQDFFSLLNQLLSAQARQIEGFEGSVIKYTGDGVMAIFKGMGHAYLALRCALELARMSKGQALPYGVGVAQGLVLAGFIGDSNQAGQRRQYDVIGATVHLASRLCGMADAGEVMATKAINAVGKIRVPAPRPIEGVLVRGFDQHIDCVVFKQPD